ncbi:hypothetical protein Vretimale_7584 [Volvox reticuliferus]|uniref:Uncharacterized protein n=1 Tax=Volvox reticuliferus TaxID=1737510 RepID=A0A8J4LNC2_9CHLO|nr:hypothetical protein Vretifemale_7644 [Volvox reticuliferus]GIM02728.1 hypothetical protein Vretimale_7584 [Volvox reticuliferus]
MNFHFGAEWLLVICLRASLLVAVFVFADATDSHNDRSLTSGVNNLFANKLDLYRGTLPDDLRKRATAEAIAEHLGPTLRFLYTDVWQSAKDHEFVVPEFGHLFENEANMLFGNITYVRRHSGEFTFEEVLQFLLATLRSFDPTRLTSILTAYPICRRTAMAMILEHYLTNGPFKDAEANLIADISQHLFKLHHRAAQTKRIIEFFHVSKSGGTSFCQLGRMNGCKTQSFGRQQNCLITYFRDSPRWTKAGVLGELSAKHGDPWCARYGRQYGMRWHCRARRALMTRMRFNFYSNELVMHDHNNSWTGVHPCREFLNVVIFREPQSRVISHMQNILKEYVNFYNESLWQAFNPNSAVQWRALAVPVFDNYVVRSLLGGKLYNMPHGTINGTHLLAAKIVTLQFEVLLSLGPETSELTRDIFGLGLGWQFNLLHMHVRPTEQRAVDAFSPEVMEAVRAAGRLDEQLYDFALVLQLLDAITFGIAHDVAGMDAVLASGDVTLATATVAGGAEAEVWAVNRTAVSTAAAAGRKRRSRGCGYVGVRRPSAPVTTYQVRLPPVAPALAPYRLSDAELGFAIEGLGAMVIAGGRWFNGEFYRNETAALDAAAAAGRATEAVMVATLATAAAERAAAAAAMNRTAAALEAAEVAAGHAASMKEKAASLAEAAARIASAAAVGRGVGANASTDGIHVAGGPGRKRLK